MCAVRALRRTWLRIVLGAVLFSGLPVAGVAQSLIEGVDSWTDAVSGRAMLKWGGQRVDFPAATPRPASLGHLDAPWGPFSVHAASLKSAARCTLLLTSAQQAADLLALSGLFVLDGDGGQGGTFQRDLYLGNFARSGAFVDGSERASDLDSARAFVLIDERLPSERLPACTSQALIEAELLELDPAESTTIRQASAAYFTRLLLGESCEESDDVESRDTLHQPAALGAWLWALGARQNHNRGGFVQSMWHFARQRTWEGSRLRGSPDLLEALAKALDLDQEKLEEVAGQLANDGALARAREGGSRLPGVPLVIWSALPVHRPAIAPALSLLDSTYLVVDLEVPRAGQRLSIWSRAESGVRWVLSATRLDQRGASLGTLNAPVRKTPDSELQIELDAATRYVLVSLTNLGNGLPDPDRSSQGWERAARLIVDRGR